MLGQCDIAVEVDEDLLIHTFTQVAMGDEQGHVHLIDALSGSVQHDLALHRNWCTALSGSRDGTLVASGSLDRTVKVISIATGELLGELEVDDPISALGFSPSGEHLAVGTTAGGLTVHDLLSGHVTLESQQEKRVTAVQFLPMEPISRLAPRDSTAPSRPSASSGFGTVRWCTRLSTGRCWTPFPSARTGHGWRAVVSIP